MSEKFKAPRGTFDVLPDAQPARERIAAAAHSILALAGYERIETPSFEDTDLFARGVGASTDIVSKQMFTFTDQGDRSLTLRPEGTAPVCRAYVEHGMHTLPQPVKLWYSGPFFRHERPQAGRYRQFFQIGAEAIGSDSPLVDAEMIILLSDLIAALGITDARLRLASLGSLESRSAYLDELRAHLRAHEADLSEEVRGRIDANPLRAFDSDHDGTKAVMESAPSLLDSLSDADAAHFASVRSLLDSAGVAYELDPTLVRGLDYYTRTVFEFACDRLGAQSGLGGGGRYDGLIAQLGGRDTPAAGWAAGIERLALAMDQPAEPEPAGVFIVCEDPGRGPEALALATELRRGGVRADLDLAERSLKGQMKQAGRSGARHAVILGADGAAQLRDLERREQEPVELADLPGRLTAPPG